MAASILNALGVPLHYSGGSSAWFSATGSGPRLYGTAGNDSIWGDSAVDVTMAGGAGDDIYYLYSAKNRAVEAGGEGIDTISTWMSYTLPAHFENLTVTGDGRYAFGNALDNIVSGSSGSQTIDGGAGNDVLTGGGGADIFVIRKGNGSDLVTDFSADDTLRLDGYGLTSFAAVRSAMSQEGDDVRLSLGDGESFVFADARIADFRAEQFRLALDRSVLTPTFADQFDTLSLSDEGGTWDARHWWAPEKGATLTGNGEKQWYINPSYAPTASVNPFSVEDGILTITAEKTPDDIRPLIEGYDYTSGMLTTHSSFSQTYGYFEIRADMPDERGTWPAFWLLPADGSWPPELDVVEMRGQDPDTVHVTVHSNETGGRTSVSSTVNVDDTQGFHSYGVLWTPEKIVWYFDDVAVASADTPSDMHDPMYMIVNLAIGGTAGAPDAGMDDGAELKIDYIRAYALDDWPM
jgi:beta-glucanase (GH16 family)